MLESTDTLFVTERNDIKAMVDFLNDKASQEAVLVELLDKAARIDAGEYVYLPAVVRGDGSAGQKASLLQRLEDTWNEQEPPPALKVLIMPAVAMLGG